MKKLKIAPLLFLWLTFVFTNTVKAEEEKYGLDLKFYENIFDHGILKRLALYLEKDNSYNYLQCAKDIKTYLTSLDWWALKMHDANGKLPPGVLQGHLQTLGSYDECLKVYNKTKENEIKGKYCLAQLPLVSLEPSPSIFNIRPANSMEIPNDESERLANVDGYNRIVFNWAVCMPDSCAAEDIQNMLRDLLSSLNVTLGKPIIQVPERYCATSDKNDWTGGEIAAVVVLSLFGLVMVSSTIYDVMTKESAEDSRKHNTLIAFSMYTNSKKLFKISKSSSTLTCLNGIRALSMLWVLIGHRYSAIVISPLLNTIDIQTWINTSHSAMISAGPMAVDSFFVLSGLLVSYIFFNQMRDKTTFNLPLFYFHRLMRLWPAMAMAIFVQSTIYYRLGSGPLWPFNGQAFVKPCHDYWWSALIYLQNYINPLAMCVGQLWYLCCDMQLYILSPILLYPLLKKPKFGIVNMVFWIALSQITLISICYSYKLGSTVTNQTDEYMTKFYLQTYTRATPWLLGFAAGYFLHKTANKKVNMSKGLAILFWIIAIVIMASIVFGMASLQNTSRKINLEDSTFNAFGRTGWAVALIIVIFLCVKGYGGPVDWFLSWDIWQILSKFTYSMYLLHVGVQYWQVSMKRVSSEFSHFQIIYTFCGDILIIFIFAYFWIIAFESPFLTLEKVLLYKPKNKPNVAVIKNEKNLEEIS